MDRYDKAEFIVRQIMCIFIAAEAVGIIYLIMGFYLSTTEYKLRFGLTDPFAFFMLAAVCLVMLIIAGGCCFSRICYIVVESLHLLAAVICIIITGGAGLAVCMLLIWRFIVYFIAIKWMNKKYKAEYLARLAESSGEYGSQTAIFHDHEEE